MRISVVIIGRNSEKIIKKNYLGKNVLNFADEIIFVDSDSSDNTVLIARSLGWTVIELSGSGRLSAAAGRFMGTLKSSGDYILFLDSDMTVDFSREFIEQQITKFLINKNNSIGIGGMTLHCFEDGRKSMVVKRKDNGEITDSFGGFCLFDRKELLKIGNWNPNVIANEENELYARIKKNKRNVILSREMVCFHHTDNPSSGLIQLVYAYLPLNKKYLRIFGAPGFGLRASIESKSTFEYLFYFNLEVLLFCLLSSLAFLIICLDIELKWVIFYLIISILIEVFVVLRKRKITFLLLMPTYLLQLVIGFFRFEKKKVIEKNGK